MKFLAYEPLVNTFNNLDDVKKFVSFELHSRGLTKAWNVILRYEP
jgi:hypothetical protein